MQSSSYQERIYDWITNGTGDAVIEAVAGSGKTTTCVEASKIVQHGPILFAAFNVAIVKELKDRLGPAAECRTINGLGHGAVMHHLGGNIKLEQYKYRDIIKQVTVDELQNKKTATEIRDSLSELVNFIQVCLLKMPTVAELDELVSHYTLELNHGMPVNWYYEKALEVLIIGATQASQGKVIAFNDQIWLPNLWDLRPKQYPFIFVDEAQDLSRGKLELILRARGRGGRMLFVGDSRQSIYGFSGADPAAWQTIIERTKATVLPLSICYRCPTSHLEHARRIVPQIEGRPDAPMGFVHDIILDQLHTAVQTNDLIICRTTAPLIATCIDLIKHRIPARVMGRDIGKSLIKLAKEVKDRYPNWNREFDFIESLDERKWQKIKEIEHRKNADDLAAAIIDRCEGLLACYEGLKPTSWDGFFAGIEDLFSDREAVITLATIHRVKGLQRERVFILHPGMLGKWGRQAWQKEQEVNLKYVALTRSSDTLFFVRDENDHIKYLQTGQ